MYEAVFLQLDKDSSSVIQKEFENWKKEHPYVRPVSCSFSYFSLTFHVYFQSPSRSACLYILVPLNSNTC